MRVVAPATKASVLPASYHTGPIAAARTAGTSTWSLHDTHASPAASAARAAARISGPPTAASQGRARPGICCTAGRLTPTGTTPGSYARRRVQVKNGALVTARADSARRAEHARRAASDQRGVCAEVGLFAMVWIGRGVWNTLNALYFTAPWWGPLRRRHPLVGRLVTAVAIGLVVFCLWTFRELLRVGHVRDVARAVFDQLDCATIRAHLGETTTDVRQGGARRYTVRIVYGCPQVRVIVADEDGRVATWAGAREECCGAPPT